MLLYVALAILVLLFIGTVLTLAGHILGVLFALCFWVWQLLTQKKSPPA